MERLNVAIRSAFTLVAIGLGVWWLVMVAARLGTAPTKDMQGNIVVDEYQRAKDILLVVLPLVTTVYGYWFGAQGKDKAEAKAEAATNQLTAVVATSPDSGLLRAAQDQYPEAFEKSDPRKGR